MDLKTRLRHFAHSVEIVVNAIIPYAVLMLLVIIVLEFFFSSIYKKFLLPIEIIYALIMIIFVLDLIFKYIHVRNIPKFLKMFWLDIIAVFPFFLFLRLFEEIAILVEIGRNGQKMLHEGLILEESGAKLVSEMEKIAKTSEGGAKFFRLERIVRPFIKLPEILHAIPNNSLKHKAILVEKEKYRKEKARNKK